jgi:AcrR family transcriptional regulator
VNKDAASSAQIDMSYAPACCPEADAPLSRADIRREKIMAAARKLFIENGFHATGMAQVAKTSGIAIAQIYRDFSSKEDIVAALVEADCGRLMMYEKLESAIDAGDVPAVRHWLHEFVEPSDDPNDAPLFAEILAESARSERIRDIFRQNHDELREHMDAALELVGPGNAAKARRTILADVISTLSIGMMHQQLMRPEADLGPVVRGVQAVLDRELDTLAAASNA